MHVRVSPQHILKAGRDNDMLYFVMSGVCRESAVVTPEEVEAKRLATLAKKKGVHRVGPVSVSPPHPTRANTLKAQLEATGRAQLAGPSGQPRVPFATLVPAYVVVSSSLIFVLAVPASRLAYARRHCIDV